MIEVINNEIYGKYTALENALGRIPSDKDLLEFDEKAEKALNAILVTIGKVNPEHKATEI